MDEFDRTLLRGDVRRLLGCDDRTADMILARFGHRRENGWRFIGQREFRHLQLEGAFMEFLAGKQPKTGENPANDTLR